MDRKRTIPTKKKTAQLVAIVAVILGMELQDWSKKSIICAGYNVATAIITRTMYGSVRCPAQTES